MRVRTLGVVLVAAIVLAGCSVLSDDEPKARAAPLTQEELDGALLAITDMPSGFAVGSGSTSEDNRGVCGQPPVDTVVPATTEAKIAFNRPPAGPYVQQVVGSFEQAKAEEYMAKLRESAACTTYTDQAADGVVSNNTVAEMSFPKLGDDTLALRVGNDRGLNADIVFIRVDNTVTRVGVAGVVVDSALTEEVARKAEDKVSDTVR